MSLDDLTKQQADTGAEIERIIRNYRKDSIDRKTEAYFDEKTKLVKSLWEKFESTDHEILTEYDDKTEHSYFKKEYFLNVSNAYKCLIEDMKKIQNQKSGPSTEDAAKSLPSSTNNDSAIFAILRRLKAATTSLERTLDTIKQLSNTESCTVYQVKSRTIERYRANIEQLHELLWGNTDDPSSFGYSTDNYYALQDEVELAIIALQEKSIANSGKNNAFIDNTPQIKLPTITLPKFDGNYLNWKPFHALFQQMVHEQDLGNSQKMWYLKTSLTGEAERLIHHLNLSDANYLSAWNMLNDNTRLLVTALLNKLLAQPTIHIESAASIKSLHDVTQECLLSLGNLGVSTETSDPLLLHMLVRRLDNNTHSLYEQGLSQPRNLQTLPDFLKFLEKRFQSLESLGTKSRNSNPNDQRRTGQFTSKTLAATTSRNSCIAWKGEHQLFACSKFLKLNPSQRLQLVQTARHCVNCLKGGHRSTECSARNSFKCPLKHNTLLHLEKPVTDRPSKETTNSTKASADPLAGSKQPITSQIISLSANAPQGLSSYVLLSTAIITLTDKWGKNINSRAILDSGSQLNFITESLLKKLGLRDTKHTLRIEGIGEGQREAQKRVNLQIHSRTTGFEANVEAHVFSKIISPQPSQYIDVSAWQIPSNIQLADPQFYQPGSIDILIGAELFYTILSVGQIKLGDNLPVLQNTVFGWTVSGRSQTNRQETNLAYCGICSEDESLDKRIEKFWQLEEPEEQNQHFTSAERRCEDFYVQTTRRDQSGHFVVKLPFNADPKKLGGSSEIALRRFHSLERRLARNPELKQQYTHFMKEYLELGHLEEVCFTMVPDPHFFLPHHCVLKPDSTTTKLRVVFDGSSKTSSNLSLNDLLATGPSIQDDVFTILLRFRLPRFVFTADIEKMYRQIKIDPADRKYQLIWWRDDPTNPLKCYQLNTVTYGTSPASYLATRSLHKLADDVEHTYPLASRTLKKNFYVDDVMSGSDNLTVAIQTQQQLVLALKSAGLKLHKWCANHPQLLQNIKPHDQAIELNFAHHSEESIKTTGITWNPKTDSFAVKTSWDLKTRITKRTASSDIAHIFDPLGILAPVVIVAKLFLQQLWQLKLDWDAALPQNLHTTWSNFREGLKALGEINFPRHVFSHKIPKNMQIHIFADASEQAYGAAAYIRATDQSHVVIVRLLCAKSKVAPLKQLTLPRLELCAAKLAVQLMRRIKKDLNFQNEQFYLWTDSMIVLSWINAESSNFHTFIANRISAIQQLSIPQQWRHVKSSENPADLPSRGLLPEKLVNNNLWFYGPMFLHGHEKLWPKHHAPIETTLERREKQRTACPGIAKIEPTNFIQNIDHHNSYRRLQRIIAYVLRFINKTRRASISIPQPRSLTVTELYKAQECIIQFMQSEEYADDIKNIKKYKEVAKTSDISSLTPFLDERGILRIGGRIEASHLSFNARHPAILPNKHPFTKLIFIALHKENMHAGPEALLNIVRQTFWAIRGKYLARTVVNNCVTCAKAKPKLLSQLMGNLPYDRVQPARPFITSGVDFCGPVFTHYKTRGKRPQKAYIAVFCCFATKAVHLELVSDLSTDGFLGALRRFMARRGHCRKIYCDNGTNFVGARNQLQEMKDTFQTDTSREKITSECSTRGIDFNFIPPRSPHFGGLWEAAVKSAKKLLQHSLMSASLTYEEMETVVIEAEAIMNSRPITPLSSDPNDLTALTPAHLLIGDTLTSSIDPRAESVKASLLTRWKLVMQIKSEFWKKWSDEYLNTLQHRYKWNQRCENVRKGMMVIIKDDNLPPLKWPLGRIHNVIKGEDGFVRVVDVKTANNILRRPIHKLAPLPIEEANPEPAPCTSDISSDQGPTNPNGTTEEVTSHRAKRARLSLGTVITTVLLALILPTTSTEITPFNSNPGLFFESIGSANIISSEWHLIAYYDLNPYWKEFEVLRNCSFLLDTITMKMHKPDSYVGIATQIKHVLNELDQTNDLLRIQPPVRTRRGALNIIGNLANALFGVLDSKYADDMSTTIDTLHQNENHIMELLRNQTSFLDATVYIMRRDHVAIQREFQRTESHFNTISSQITTIQDGLYQENLAQYFSALALQTLLTINNFQRSQNSILDVLSNTQHDRLSRQLISPNQLKSELVIIRTNLPSSSRLPLDLTDILKYYSITSLEGRVTRRHIIFKLRLPLLQSEEFELFRLIPVPVNVNDTSRAIRPSFPFLIVNLHRDHYYPLTEPELNSCISVDTEKYMCKQNHPLYKLGSAVSECEIGLLNRLPTNYLCQIMTMSKGPYWAQMHNPNHWIYSLESETTINVVCRDNMTQMTIQKTGILKIDSDCTIKQPLITIQGHKVYPMISRTSYVPSINLTDMVSPRNLTSALQYHNQYSPHLQDLETMKQQLQDAKIELPKLMQSHNTHHYSLGYFSLVLIITVVIVLTLKLLYKRTVNSSPPCQGNNLEHNSTRGDSSQDNVQHDDNLEDPFSVNLPI